MIQYNVGLVGLGVMGANLLLNLESHGFSGIGYDIKRETALAFAQKAEGKKLDVAKSFKELAEKLAAPRKVMVMVPAGSAVDEALKALSQVLEPGDIIATGTPEGIAPVEREDLIECTITGLGSLVNQVV